MSNIIGLDISTSIIGICALDLDSTAPENGYCLEDIFLDHINFKKCNTLWEKADRVQQYFKDHSYLLKDGGAIFVEDAALMFSRGMSSATTIATLLRFNGLVSYMARNTFGVDPVFLSPAAARKSIGLKMQQVKKCQKSHKMQVFEQLAVTDLAKIDWPLKKSGKIVDWAYDVTDAYVIAKAGVIQTLNQSEQTVI